jgi:hypothetical protein
MTSVFANPQLKAARAARCPTSFRPYSREIQPSPQKPLAHGKRHPLAFGKEHQLWIKVNRSSDFARRRTATLPTFHHDRRDAIATAAIRPNR